MRVKITEEDMDNCLLSNIISELKERLGAEVSYIDNGTTKKIVFEYKDE